MRKSTLLLLSLLLGCSLTSRADALKVGYFDFPPHTFPKKSGLPSAAQAYFDKIAQSMGIDVEYIQQPLSRLVFLLDHQHLDAVLFLAKTDARTKAFAFPAAPYFTTDSVFVVPRTSGLKSAQDIAQKNTLQLAVWEGGFHSPTLAASNNQLIPLGGNDVASRGILLVTKGRFDAFFSPDRYAIEYAAQANQQTDQIRILPIAKDTIDIYTVFSKKSAQLHLKNYEKALKKINAEMSYKTFLINFQKNLPQQPADSSVSEDDLSLAQ